MCCASTPLANGKFVATINVACICGRPGARGGAGAPRDLDPDRDEVQTQEEDGGAQQRGGRGVPGRVGGAEGPGRRRLHPPGDIRSLDDLRLWLRPPAPGAEDAGLQEVQSLKCFAEGGSFVLEYEKHLTEPMQWNDDYH